ncbi:MAG: DUF2062 domain-containing protein [Planctomycetota bacterium]|nr:DUF2062 domain-containing protein [Planctomycetota bacterium]
MATRSWRRRYLAAIIYFRRLARSQATPYAIAMGVAIGFVVGWLPIIGFQMMVAAPLCLLLRANFLAAVPIIWLTNPFTAIPIYGANYWVGKRLCDALDAIIGRDLVDAPPLWGSEGFLARLRALEPILASGGWREVGTALWELTLDFMLPLWLGCLVVGLALAVPGYFITYRWVVRLRARWEKKRLERLALQRQIAPQK